MDKCVVRRCPLPAMKADFVSNRGYNKGHRIPPEKTTFSRVRTLLNRPLFPPQAVATREAELGTASTFEVSSEILTLQCSCLERLKFEVEYGLKRGTTENTYLVKGATRETTFLIDLPNEAFAATFLLELQKAIPAKKIGTVVLTHLQLESISVLKSLIEVMQSSEDRPIDIVAASPAVRLLQSSLGEEGTESDILKRCRLKTVQPGMTLDGDGLQLEFVRAATPRWPDMLCIYVPQRRMLFSSKLFSAHVASQLADVQETAFDAGGWQMYGQDWEYFFETMLAPSAKQTGKALEALNLSPASSVFSLPDVQNWIGSVMSWLNPREATKKEASVPRRELIGICPMHGPIVRNALHELVENYTEWIRTQISAVGTVAVLYASAYGNTAALAQAISHGINKTGLGVRTLNLETVDPSEIENSIDEVNGFVIGSPTLGGHMPTQVQSALGSIVRNARAKQLPCGVFGSFGWSGEAVDEMEQRLKDAGFEFGFNPIKIKMKPTAKDLQVCEESGTDLAQLIEKKLKKRSKQVVNVSRSRSASGAAQAIGRIVGSLCVVTGKDGDAESGMLASWVSQASFNPPGVTVAVKKDRAVENVLLPGNRFNVNILADGKETEVVKHLLKPFKPGEDRFKGLVAEVCEETDCVIVHNAVSYLECTVKERMETGDHWVVYATIEGGSVLDANSVSAMHHRKVGTNY